MERYVIKTPKAKRDMTSYFVDYMNKKPIVDEFLERISEDKYLHWEDARFKPVDIEDIDDLWFMAKIARQIKSTEIPIISENGNKFKWYRQKKTDKILMEFDKAVGGNTLSDTPYRASKEKYIISGIMEEAISSSLLEGANTTRKYAKKMLSEKIKPRNADEMMVLNHHKTLTLIDEEYKDMPMSKELLLLIQSNLTKGTLDDENQLGRFRTDKDEIVVRFKDKIIFTPPKQDFLMKELDRLIDYANDDSEFIHPLIKASILHFWIGYLHPFCDGNGRTARTIFYWYLLKQGYWGISLLPISSTILKSRVQYTNSYIYAEQDDLDFTYFFDYISKKVLQTINSFNSYVSKKSKEISEANEKYKNIGINDRQIGAINSLKGSTNYITIRSQVQLNNIGIQTARKDLKDLVAKNILVEQKIGREVRYFLK